MKREFSRVVVSLLLLLTVFGNTGCLKSLSDAWYGKPVGFKYYVSSGAGTTQNSKSGSTVVKGSVKNDETEISFGSQEQVGGSAVSDFDWTGAIDGEIHREIARLVETTVLEELSQSSAKNAGGSWNVFEITLLYPGDKERKGLPANPQEWHGTIEKIERFARQNKP